MKKHILLLLIILHLIPAAAQSSINAFAALPYTDGTTEFSFWSGSSTLDLGSFTLSPHISSAKLVNLEFKLADIKFQLPQSDITFLGYNNSFSIKNNTLLKNAGYTLGFSFLNSKNWKYSYFNITPNFTESFYAGLNADLAGDIKINLLNYYTNGTAKSSFMEGTIKGNLEMFLTQISKTISLDKNIFLFDTGFLYGTATAKGKLSTPLKTFIIDLDCNINGFAPYFTTSYSYSGSYIEASILSGLIYIPHVNYSTDINRTTQLLFSKSVYEDTDTDSILDNYFIIPINVYFKAKLLKNKLNILGSKAFFIPISSETADTIENTATTSPDSNLISSILLSGLSFQISYSF